jgi:beta-glucanase (GH16 family)
MIPLNHFTKHKFKDAFKNSVQNTKAVLRKLVKGKSRLVQPPKDYKLVFEDNFTTLDESKWKLGQAWGDFHPEHLYQYYDITGELVYTTSEGLSLDLRKKPKHYIKADLPTWRQTEKMPDEFTIPVGVGLVTTLDSWQWGWFESEIKLPKGEAYWPAFWLSGVNTWPPEIDIFEAYSDKGAYYNNKLLKLFNVKDWKIQPNIHWGDTNNGTKEQYGSYNSPVNDVTERFVQYVCHWERDFIRIYYDGLLILECTDKKVLDWFNRQSDKMNIIINHGLHSAKVINPDESSMIIKYVKVYQK